MNLFDLHCDTIVLLKEKKEDFIQNTTQFSLRDLNHFGRMAQTMAVFVPDDVRGEAAVRYVDTYDTYMEMLAKRHADICGIVRKQEDIRNIIESGRCALLKAIESGAALAGNLENITYFHDKGYQMMTLVWNGENEIGSGHQTPHGLSTFGKDVVKRMEEEGMIIDVSHINDRGFDEVAALTSKPFVASHSNARSVCKHKRNLTDAQFSIIRDRKGIVGLNLYKGFLSDGESCGMEALYEHVYHFLSLDGAHTIACGSDFDGADIGGTLDTPYKFATFGEFLYKKGISQSMIDDLFFRNAQMFFEANMK